MSVSSAQEPNWSWRHSVCWCQSGNTRAAILPPPRSWNRLIAHSLVSEGSVTSGQAGIRKFAGRGAFNVQLHLMCHNRKWWFVYPTAFINSRKHHTKRYCKHCVVLNKRFFGDFVYLPFRAKFYHLIGLSQREERWTFWHLYRLATHFFRDLKFRGN